MSSTLNAEKLAEMIKNKRGDKGLRAAASEIGGVSASTLSRIEQGSLPDIDTFIKICNWLNVSTDYFTRSEEHEVVSYQKEVVAHLRADKILDPTTAESLIQMITLAYEHTKVNVGKKKNKK